MEIYSRLDLRVLVDEFPGSRRLWPWQYTLERLPTAEYNYFAAVGSEMVKAVAAVDGDRWVSQPGADLYPHSGGLVDYCYEAGISSFTFEGRGSSFIVPDSAILPAGQEQLAAVVTMAQQVRV